MDRTAGRRERNRHERHRGYLKTALRIATEEGLHAVTMPRLADELDCAVGTVYTYFRSKSALMAEVQRKAIERLTASYLVLTAEVDAVLAGHPSELLRSMTHVLAVGHFWIDISRTYPQETRLLQLLMSSADQAIADDDVSRIVPAAFEHIQLASDRFAAAEQHAALRVGAPLARTITFAAAINGVIQVGRLSRLAPDLLDGHRLAGAVVDDLLLGWGAPKELLSAAHAQLAALAAQGSLARPIPEGAA